MKRERLKFLERILDARQQVGAIYPETNNGLVLFAVLSNRNDEKALRENVFYDPMFIGDILAKHDTHLACITYARENCDGVLIELINIHQLFKEKARHCVSHQSPELWTSVLSTGNDHMKLVVDDVISTALPDCDEPNKVS